MIISTEFLVYVALYRLSVLTVGALSIYFGFRLFARSDEDKLDSGATVPDVKAWKIKMNRTNFWPGAFFTLFGTGLIGVMLWQGAPQLTLEDLKETQAGSTAPRAKGESEAMHLPAEGLEPCIPEQLPLDVQEQMNREWSKLKRPGLTLAEASVHLNHIARIWQQTGHITEALVMARLACLYGTEEDRAIHLALYAELLEANGEVQKAVEAHKELVELGTHDGGGEK